MKSPGEVKNARKTIPYSLVISLVVILVIYIGVGATLTGTVNWRQAASSPAAIAESAASFYPDQLVTLISLGALFASATTINALLTSVSRDILKLGRDSVLPRAFGNVSRRFGTPYAGVLSVTIVVIITLLIGLDIEQYSMITVFSFLLMQCICAVAVFRIPKLNYSIWNHSPIRFTRGWRMFTLIALIGTSLLIFGFATVDDAITASVFAAVLCMGFVFWLVRSRFLAAKNISLTTNMRQLSDDIADEMND